MDDAPSIYAVSHAAIRSRSQDRAIRPVPILNQYSAAASRDAIVHWSEDRALLQEADIKY